MCTEGLNYLIESTEICVMTREIYVTKLARLNVAARREGRKHLVKSAHTRPEHR